jgi:sulfotransferase family protein
MMADLNGHDWWHEPMVGYLSGHLYHERAGCRRGDEHFVLGGPRELWLDPVRAFVLDSASARFPEVAARGGYQVVKEPHGAQGAPLLMEALPVSRMILLVRDPRDVVASRMDLASKGSVTREAMQRRGQEKKNLAADERPEDFVESQARRYVRHIGFVKQAYDAHEGPKALVRYEDLRTDPLGTMRRLCSGLGIKADDDELTRVVHRHAWENFPERKKGPGKFFRKASPGGWTEDLTPEQAKAVERITAPILEEFYAQDRHPSSNASAEQHGAR